MTQRRMLATAALPPAVPRRFNGTFLGTLQEHFASARVNSVSSFGALRPWFSPSSLATVLSPSSSSVSDRPLCFFVAFTEDT